MEQFEKAIREHLDEARFPNGSRVANAAPFRIIEVRIQDRPFEVS